MNGFKTATAFVPVSSHVLNFNWVQLSSLCFRVCSLLLRRGCHGRDRMVVGFTTTCICAIRAHHH
jgi:hypothetical protein